MNILSWFKILFSKALRIVEEVLKSVFTIGFKILMAKLQDIATESITKLATTDMSNQDKRNQAFKEIKAYAVSKTLSFSNSDINLIIEVIYKQLKNEGIIK